MDASSSAVTPPETGAKEMACKRLSKTKLHRLRRALPSLLPQHHLFSLLSSIPSWLQRGHLGIAWTCELAALA